VSDYQPLKNPFSRYEVTVKGELRNIATKKPVTFVKDSCRLVNDAGQRVTIKKSEFAAKFRVDVEKATAQPIEETNQSNQTTEETMATKVKAKAKKQPKEKKQKVEFVPTAEMKAIVKGEGTKTSKMKTLFKLTKSVTHTAQLLETNYAFVYNVLNGNYEKKK
jgi:hypothetical protein